MGMRLRLVFGRDHGDITSTSRSQRIFIGVRPFGADLIGRSEL